MKRTRPKRKWKRLTDESLFPNWGKHAGKKMANVPADYFLWLDKQGWATYDIQEYIRDNMNALLQERDCDATEIDIY